MDLRAKPFHLNEKQLQWVEDTLESMSLEDKLGQLFFSAVVGDPKKAIEEADAIGFRPGGYLLRGATAQETRERVAALQEHFPIPLLISGDLDRGAVNLVTDGTSCGQQMGIAATGETSLAYEVGRLTAQECMACGVNWNFGPVVDIDYNPFNPVTNVRTFGSDPEKVADFASAMARGIMDGGMISCMKHWPGDGRDFRDQHFLTSINDMSVEDWTSTYGRIYGRLIEEGVETLMTAHILFPAYSRYYKPDIRDQDMLPASLNYDLHNRLLREKLGFQGVIITDASVMVGFTETLPRSLAVPMCIANGADFVLFNRNKEEDLQYMREGYEKGILTPERLNEAVTRILALKASHNLHIKKKEGTLVPPKSALEAVGTEQGKELAKKIADKSITLVKDVKHLLPLDPEKQKHLYVISLGDVPNYHNGKGGYVHLFAGELEKKGFQVTIFDKENPDDPIHYARGKVADLRQQVDVIIYFANVCTSNADSAARISWPGWNRASIPLLLQEIPMLLVSVDNPYLLIDMPRVPAYINAYTSDEVTVKALAGKIAGESPFYGKSPIDPFAGIFNAKY